MAIASPSRPCVRCQEGARPERCRASGGTPHHPRLYTEAPGPSRRKTPHEDPGAGILGLQFGDCRPSRKPSAAGGCILPCNFWPGKR